MMSGRIPTPGTTSDEDGRAFESAASDLSSDSVNETYGSFDSLPPAKRTKRHPTHLQPFVKRKNQDDRSPLMGSSHEISGGLDIHSRVRDHDEFFSPTVSPVTSPDIQDRLEDEQMNIPRLEDERKSYMITLPDVNTSENDSGWHIM